MNKLRLGVVLGIVAGIIDVIPMIAQNLTWDANLSAFSMWVAVGFLISTSNLKIKASIKGLLISYSVMIPVGIIIGWKEPISLVPIIIMTTILGSTLGYLIEKYGK